MHADVRARVCSVFLAFLSLSCGERPPLEAHTRGTRRVHPHLFAHLKMGAQASRQDKSLLQDRRGVRGEKHTLDVVHAVLLELHCPITLCCWLRQSETWR